MNITAKPGWPLRLGAFLACLLFVLTGLPFIPRVGLQYDEVFFASGIYPPVLVEYSSQKLHNLPLMLVSYAGALKIWVYRVILRLFAPTPYALRVPVLLAGALSVFLFFQLLRTMVPGRWAVFGALLLATDAVYLLTSLFDWGPVAFQHVLLLCGLLAAVRLCESGRPWWGFVSALFFGLALWDKAIFIWVMAGLAAGLWVVYPRRAFALLRARWALPLALCGFLCGTAPLLDYNVRSQGNTFRGNARAPLSEFPGKLGLLRKTVEGSALFGYMIRDGEAPPANPTGIMEQVSFCVSNAFGQPKASLEFLALLVSTLCMSFLGDGRRAALFAFLAGAVALVLMISTENAGGAAHHHVLLWPLPPLLITLVLADLASRWKPAGGWAAAILAVVLCGSNFLVTNQYFRQLVQEGTSAIWTDAVFPLDSYLKETRPERIFVVDWGIYEPLRFLGAGRHNLVPGSDGVVVELKPGGWDGRLNHIRDAGTVFIGHASGNEVFAGVNGKLLETASSLGCHKVPLRTISDSKSRPVFEVFRFGP